MLMPFAHISDTHLDCPGSSDFIKRLHREVRDPLENLTCCLQELAARKVAFVLHTGDMVHEGDAGDYAILRRLFDKYLPGVPVIAAMGNHDHRAAFREGFLGIPSPGDEDFTQEVVLDGLRILVLDSAKSGLIGSVSDAQVDWLEERLASPAPRGTFLMMHHPTVCEHPAMALEVSPEFSSLVENSDIHAIFTGHTHSNYNGFLPGSLFTLPIPSPLGCYISNRRSSTPPAAPTTSAGWMNRAGSPLTTSCSIRRCRSSSENPLPK